MSDTDNKPTTLPQKVLIGLICVVLILFLGQLLFSQSGSDLPTDREGCLASGNIWSQSAERCFDAGSDPSTATTAVDYQSGKNDV
ncbi:MAG: hypothetical protein WD552_01925 [Candidatus Paceibacterota bacterium]